MEVTGISAKARPATGFVGVMPADLRIVLCCNFRGTNSGSGCYMNRLLRATIRGGNILLVSISLANIVVGKHSPGKR